MVAARLRLRFLTAVALRLGAALALATAGLDLHAGSVALHGSESGSEQASEASHPSAPAHLETSPSIQVPACPACALQLQLQGAELPVEGGLVAADAALVAPLLPPLPAVSVSHSLATPRGPPAA
ncbi:MAG: hypothetical protein U0X73_04090 [Thermoanaerobaculia bacterium]